MLVNLVGDVKPVLYAEQPIMVVSSERPKYNAFDHIGKTF